MIETIYNIWRFIQDLYTILRTVWVLVVGGIRFVFRAVSASLLFVVNFPQEIAVVLVISITVGLCLFALGRN